MARVLVVDDNQANLRLLSMIIVSQGHTVQTAVHGEDALRLIIDPGLFDLAMLDYMMPGMTGLDLTYAIRKIDKLVRIVIVTAYCIEDAKTDFAMLDVHDFIQKPYTLNTIRSTLACVGIKPVI